MKLASKKKRKKKHFKHTSVNVGNVKNNGYTNNARNIWFQCKIPVLWF